MKRLTLIVGVLFLALIAIAYFAVNPLRRGTTAPIAAESVAGPSINEAGLEITYIANEGVLISSGDTQVLIDGLHREYQRDYAFLPAAQRNRIENAQTPFHQIDLVGTPAAQRRVLDPARPPPHDVRIVGLIHAGAPSRGRRNDGTEARDIAQRRGAITRELRASHAGALRLGRHSGRQVGQRDRRFAGCLPVVEAGTVLLEEDRVLLALLGEVDRNEAGEVPDPGHPEHVLALLERLERKAPVLIGGVFPPRSQELHQRVGEHADSVCEQGPPAQGHVDADEALHRLLESLSEKKRTVLVLHDFEGMSARDIAPIRVARRSELLALDVRDRRFGYPVEMLQKATLAGWRIVERDVAYHPRAEGTRSKVSGSVRGTVRTARDFWRVLT